MFEKTKDRLINLKVFIVDIWQLTPYILNYIKMSVKEAWALAKIERNGEKTKAFMTPNWEPQSRDEFLDSLQVIEVGGEEENLKGPFLDSINKPILIKSSLDNECVPAKVEPVDTTTPRVNRFHDDIKLTTENNTPVST